LANKLQAIVPPILDTVIPNAQGNIAVGIKHLVANNQIEQLTFNVQSPKDMPPLLEPKNDEIEFDRHFYNFFVVGNDFDITTDNPFRVRCDRVLKEYMDENLKSMFLPLSDEIKIEHIKRLPCIFANENRRDGSTDEEQILSFGYVRDIQLRREGIKIYPHVIYRLSQQRLNEALFDLDLWGNDKCNEFNRMHWSIKKVDLIAELQEMGFQI